jgi:hypothetical protein
MPPGEFVRQLRTLLKTRSAPAVVAFYDRYAPPLLERLSEAQQLQLEEIMHWADTVVELEADRAPATPAPPMAKDPARAIRGCQSG